MPSTRLCLPQRRAFVSMAQVLTLAICPAGGDIPASARAPALCKHTHVLLVFYV